MIVPGSDHLIVILGVETQPLNSLPVGLLGEIEMSYHAVQHVLLMIVLGLFTVGFNPRVYQGLDISVTLGVVGN